MSEEMRTFGYLCPACGGTVMGTQPVFALEASGGEVACSCGKSALRIAFDGTRWRLYVPCGLCGETHTALCPPERLLRGDTALACARTKQFCCFIGGKAAAGSGDSGREGEAGRREGVLRGPDYHVRGPLRAAGHRRPPRRHHLRLRQQPVWHGNPPVGHRPDLPGLRSQAPRSRGCGSGSG